MEERIGHQLGSYRLVQLLGQGGFADVYLGEHIHLQTLAAVKVLQMRLVGSNLEQFRNEARTIASLIHPHIVRVLDFGVEDRIPFLVMEYAPNGTLYQAYPQGKHESPRHIVPYVNQIADALYYAHSRKLMHRDIKPENILLAADGKVLLSDFGLVKAVQNTMSQANKEMAGTIAYMAPEQLHGKPRPASDQYALGIIVYELLSGNRPFQGSLFEIAIQHIMSPPRALYGNIPGISREVEEVVFCALAKDPHQRFASVKDFAIAFEQAALATRILSFSTSVAMSLPSNSSSSLPSFTTSLIANLSQPGEKNSATGQLAPQFSWHTIPVISSSPAAIPAPVDSAWQAMHMHTPLPVKGSQSFVNSSSSLSVVPISSHSWPDQFTPSHTGTCADGSPIEPTFLLITPGQAAIQARENVQKTFISPRGIATESMGQQVTGLSHTMLPSPSIDGPKPAKPWKIALALMMLVLIISSVAVYAFPKQLAMLSARSKASLVGHAGSSPGKQHTVSMGSLPGLVPARAHALVPALTPIPILAPATFIDTDPVPLSSVFATITITSSRKIVKNVFTISAVTGIPNSSQSQVQARQVTASQSHSQTTNATGSKQVPATHATGTLVMTCHASLAPITINAGTVFIGNDKVSVVTDTAVTTSGCHTTISAHTVDTGPSGNIAANDVNQPYQGYTVLNESAFSGGQNATTTTIVAQSDIDTSATSLEGILTPTVKQTLPTLLRSNERTFGDPQCSPGVSSHPMVGDEAANVIVTVAMTCIVEAYDNAGAQAMANALLTKQAASDPGADYSLEATIATAMGQPTLVDAAHGTISLPVTAEGAWVYLWSDAQKQNLARLVAGRSVLDAKSLLLGQKGVDTANIELSPGNDGILPSDPRHIAMHEATATLNG